MERQRKEKAENAVIIGSRPLRYVNYFIATRMVFHGERRGALWQT